MSAILHVHGSDRTLQNEKLRQMEFTVLSSESEPDSEKEEGSGNDVSKEDRMVKRQKTGSEEAAKPESTREPAGSSTAENSPTRGSTAAKKPAKQAVIQEVGLKTGPGVPERNCRLRSLRT